MQHPITIFTRNMICTCVLLTAVCVPLNAQSPFLKYDDPIPTGLEQMYKRGLKFLAESQQTSGLWSGSYGNQAGVVGLSVLAFLAHGDDPNTGPYSTVVQRGISFIISQQNVSTGYIGSSMYNHGFATLALAEAYGVVNDPKIGKALDSALRLLISSQARNPYGAWRYSSDSNSADTTVSGACLVALLAGRNAGMDIPDTVIKKALNYYRTCQASDGGFGYTSANGSGPVTSVIGALSFALARKRKTTAFKDALNYMKQSTGGGSDSYRFYYLYYASQAYFHADPTTNSKIWNIWNRNNINFLKQSQSPKGSWTGSHGEVFSTSAALLSLALNYRLLPIYER